MPDRYGEDGAPLVPADPEHIAYLQAKAIVDCDLCDDSGRQGMHRCDHSTVHAQAAARWMPVIREILGKETTK